jgi:hypothetical protein
MTTYNVFVSVGMASRGRRAPQSIHERDVQKKNAERASDTANDATHEYTIKGKAKLQNERQLLRTAGHLPGADAVFSSFNRRLENDGIRPRKVASLAEPQSLRTMLRFALVLPLHDDIQSPRGRSSEVGVTRRIYKSFHSAWKRGAISSKRARSAAPSTKSTANTVVFDNDAMPRCLKYMCIYIHASNPALDSSISASCAPQD